MPRALVIMEAAKCDAPQTLDPTRMLPKITPMIRRFITNAIHSSIEELLAKPIGEFNRGLADVRENLKDVRENMKDVRENLKDVRENLKDVRENLKDVREGLQEVREGLKEVRGEVRATNVRIDELSVRVDGLSSSLSSRIDGVSSNLSSRIDDLSTRMDEFGVQQGRLIEDVAGLKRDRDVTQDILHRMARIEDRVFAKAG